MGFAVAFSLGAISLCPQPPGFARPVAYDQDESAVLDLAEGVIGWRTAASESDLIGVHKSFEPQPGCEAVDGKAFQQLVYNG